MRLILEFYHRRKGLVFASVALVVAGLGLAGWRVTAASKVDVGDPFKALGVQRLEEKPKAPPFALPDMGGKTVQLADFKGKAILLNFFATWCTPCRWEMPELERLHQAYKDKGFTVLAVSIDRSPRVIPPFVKEMSLTFPILHDPGIEVARRYGLRGPPLTYIIDAKGRLIGGAAGPREWNNKSSRQIIEALLKDAAS